MQKVIRGKREGKLRKATKEKREGPQFTIVLFEPFLCGKVAETEGTDVVGF